MDKHELWFRTASSEQLGEFGESFWKSVFQSSGMRYVSLCNIAEGGAPLARGDDKIVLPDFDTYGDDWTALIDSKVKSGPILWRKSGELRHGINKSSYQNYQRFGVLSVKRAGLAIVELFKDCDTKIRWSGSLLVESFINIEPPIDGFNEKPAKVYWPRKRLSDLDTLTAEELFLVVERKKEASYRAELCQIFSGPAGTPKEKRACGPHTFANREKQKWKETRVKNRIRTSCGVCGCFLGYRNVE